MPVQATELLEDSLQRSTESKGSGVVMTVVGLALALWSTTSAATTLMQGLTRAYGTDDARSFLMKRVTALGLVAILVVGTALVVFFLVLGPHVEGWLGSALEAEGVTTWAWWTLQWPVLLAALLFAFVTVLDLGPNVEHRNWKLVIPGAVSAVVVWLVASGGFALYAAHFGSYNKSWGTLSDVVVTLVWLWLTSAALLFGAEVNAEAQRLATDNEQRAG